MARRLKTKIIGAKEVTQNLAMAGNRWKDALKSALYLEANNIMARSKHLVPVDLGALKGSGYVTLPVETGSKILVEMGYGGPAKDYAIVQHERLDFQHPQGGEAKFLEKAVDEATPSMASDLLKLAKAQFEHGSITITGTAPTNPDSGEAGASGAKLRRSVKASKTHRGRKRNGGGGKK